MVRTYVTKTVSQYTPEDVQKAIESLIFIPYYNFIEQNCLYCCLYALSYQLEQLYNLSLSVVGNAI